MKRQDWLWLLIKAAGLWLIVAGIEELAAVGFDSFRPGALWDSGVSDKAVAVLLLLGSGVFLLLVNVSKWLGRMERRDRADRGRAGGDMAVESGGDASAGMRREDWLWVGLKLLGAYFLFQGVAYLLTFARFSSVAGDSSLWEYAAGALYVLFGLWLLLGEWVYRLASRCSRSNKASSD